MDLNAITLGGHTIEELKKTQAEVRQDASKFIAEAMDEAEKLVFKVLEWFESNEEGDPTPEVATNVTKAAELLDAVQIVSGVSGVTYYVPYYTEYGYDDDSPWSSRFEELENWNEILRPLTNNLESMEYDSKLWHESRC